MIPGELVGENQRYKMPGIVPNQFGSLTTSLTKYRLVIHIEQNRLKHFKNKQILFIGLLGIFQAQSEDYEIMKKIGEGSFGFVYKVRHKTTHELYAIKTDEKSVTKTELENEVAILQLIQKRINNLKQNSQKVKFPINICLESFFYESYPNKMLMPLYGENLMNLFHKCNGSLDSNTIYEVSKAMLKSIWFIHDLGFIHRDIKPQNFVAGQGHDDYHKESMDDGIYLVDFGLAKEYLRFKAEKRSIQHIDYEINRKIRGTLMYMSVNLMLGIEPSRRDDLESFMYVLILFLKGRLPWHNINVTRKNFDELIKAKILIHPDDLFAGIPSELKHTFIYIRKLKFEETPNYNKIMQSLESILSFKNPKIQQEYSGKYHKYCWEAVYKKQNMKELSENMRQYMKKKKFIDGFNSQKEYSLMPQ